MIRLEEACTLLGIHSATLRNWIRLGRIETVKGEDGKLLIPREKLSRLQEELAQDATRLKRRRNKSAVVGRVLCSDYLAEDSPNREMAMARLREALRSEDPASSLEILLEETKKELSGEVPGGFRYVAGEDLPGLIYISGRSLGHRKSGGMYYTPSVLVQKMLDGLSEVWQQPDLTILDPCCGTGNFLLQLPESVRPENIYGYDVDEEALKLARWNLALRYPQTDPSLWEDHIRHMDTLTETEEQDRFDLILGNPPWGAVGNDKKSSVDLSSENAVRKDKRDSVDLSSENAVRKDKRDSADLFTEKALRMVRTGGIVAFVLPEALLNVASHRGLREHLLASTSIRRLVYLGDAFRNVQCPVILITLEKTGKPMSTRGLTVELTDGAAFTIQGERQLTAAGFPLHQTERDVCLLRKIREGSRFTLKGQARFAMGIVTGDNRRLLQEGPGKDREMILKGADIEAYGIQPTETTVCFRPEEFQQCAGEEVFRAPVKLIYRFIGDHPVVALDRDGCLTLNSANLLIPEPHMAVYIMAVLNSPVAAFWWRKQYRTMKILRSQLEEFPFPRVDERTRKRIEKMIADGEYAAAHRIICRCYGFDEAETDEIMEEGY